MGSTSTYSIPGTFPIRIDYNAHKMNSINVIEVKCKYINYVENTAFIL